MVKNGGSGRSAAVVWQNVLNTFIVASDNRGSKTIVTIWGDKLANVTLVSDRIGGPTLGCPIKGQC